MPDRSVYTTTSVRPIGPCQLTPAMAGPIFSYLWNPYPSFPGGFYDFHGGHVGLGAHTGDSQISGTWAPLDCLLHISCLELKAVEAVLHDWAPVLQGHQVMTARDNSTVVSYINKQGGTRSHTWGQVHQTDVNLTSYNGNIGRGYVRRLKFSYSVCTIGT